MRKRSAWLFYFNLKLFDKIFGFVRTNLLPLHHRKKQIILFTLKLNDYEKVR